MLNKRAFYDPLYFVRSVHALLLLREFEPGPLLELFLYFCRRRAARGNILISLGLVVAAFAVRKLSTPNIICTRVKPAITHVKYLIWSVMASILCDDT